MIVLMVELGKALHMPGNDEYTTSSMLISCPLFSPSYEYTQP
jgi:hypothetical protein